MLAVCHNEAELKPAPKRKDIIVTKFETKIEYENGVKMERRVPVKTNVTKLVNETKKIVKQNKASETLAEIEKLMQTK